MLGSRDTDISNRDGLKELTVVDNLKNEKCSVIFNHILKNTPFSGLPYGPAVKNPPFFGGDPDSITGGGTKIQYATTKTRCSHK